VWGKAPQKEKEKEKEDLPMSSKKLLQIKGSDFVDQAGRTYLLRGVNLAGSSKIPAHPPQPTHLGRGVYELAKEISFVGRPLQRDTLRQHLTRLRRWGLYFLRYLVTWEGIAHKGAGELDQDYLDYTAEVLEEAGKMDFLIWIDPHQDVWSRFTGGDGAPYWTFEAAGMEPRSFQATGAAVLHYASSWDYAPMIWPTNADKLACATMATLFFGGERFAPSLRVGEENIQSFLQDAYCGALAALASRLRGMPHVLGYGTMNEPCRGWIGHPDLAHHHTRLTLGAMPTPYQAMLLGSGFAQEVDVWRMRPWGMQRLRRRRRIDPGRARAWATGHDCPWRRHGIWDLDASGQPQLLQPRYFHEQEGEKVDFYEAHLKPFFFRFAKAIQRVDPEAMIFLEGMALEPAPCFSEGEDTRGFVHAPHWYDAQTLFLKRWLPYIGFDYRDASIRLGQRAAQEMREEQLAAIKRHAAMKMGGMPTVIGEFGIPFDMHKKQALKTGEQSKTIAAMDAGFRAMEATLQHSTLWNYTPDNTHRFGDQWNDEDLSIFSLDEPAHYADPLDQGGRALEAVVRPYPKAIAGQLLHLCYDYKTRSLHVAFLHDPAINAPTLLFLPATTYPDGFHATLSDGSYSFNEETRELAYTPAHTKRQVHTLTIEPRPSR
jgi:hypothetical protein